MHKALKSVETDTKATDDHSGYTEALLNTQKQQAIASTLYERTHAQLFSRKAEFEADKLGIDLLIAANYSPQQYRTSLERIAHSYSLSNQLFQQLQDNFALMLEQQSTDLQASLSEGAEKDELQNQIEDVAGDWHGKTEKKLMTTFKKFLADSHPVPEDRITEITEYLFNNYSRKERGRAANTKNISSLHNGSLGQLLNNIEAANTSMTLIHNGDYEAATPLALKGISAPSSRNAYTRFVAYRLRDLQGNKASAIKNLTIYDKPSFVPIEHSLLIAKGVTLI